MAEAQKRLASQVQLPGGYYIRWGGQFENLQAASDRLLVVVPLATVVIGGRVTSTLLAVACREESARPRP